MRNIERQRFRPDIQGLRALAILLVLLYHAGFPMLPGGYVGVDVFFVISGFLITNHLLAQLSQHGRIDFASFYGKRARRILPASLLVAVLTLAAAWLWVAPLELRSVFQDAIATALYAPNLLFASQGTDYLAGEAPSLFQHYWSLGIEEQFYLVWPALIAASFVLARKSRRGLFWALLTVVALSLIAGIFLTQVSQPWAFFSLPTRAWELGIGGLLAFAITSRRWRPSSATASFGGWAGIVGVVATAVAYDDSAVFPGIAAILPVASAAAVLYFGQWSTRTGPEAALARRPMLFVGKISYSLYLLHWPALVMPTQLRGIERDLPLWVSLSIAALCVPLAYVLYRWVELPAQSWRPLRQARPRRTLAAAALVPLAVVAAAATSLGVLAHVPLSTSTTAQPSAAGQLSYADEVPQNLQPSLGAASDSVPATYEEGCHAPVAETMPVGCMYGANAGAPLVALFGDSHAAQWFPALDEAASDGTIRLRVDTKSSCPSVDIEKLEDGLPYTACDQWRGAVVSELNALSPDIILISNYGRSDGFQQGATHLSAWGEGLEEVISELPATSDVVVLADSPQLPLVPATCLSAHLHDARQCGSPRDVALSQSFLETERDAARAADARFIDLSDSICSISDCMPITGDLLIYRDSNHLTVEFASSLSPVLREALLDD